MSYKLDLSRLQRDTSISINAQLVELVRSAIERGELQPGQKLPTTRALAEAAKLNHLTVVPSLPPAGRAGIRDPGTRARDVRTPGTPDGGRHR